MDKPEVARYLADREMKGMRLGRRSKTRSYSNFNLDSNLSGRAVCYRHQSVDG
jgi:hypothetical protein